MTLLFVLFWISVGCCAGYVLASIVYAGKLEDERARILARLRDLQRYGEQR